MFHSCSDYFHFPDLNVGLLYKSLANKTEAIIVKLVNITINNLHHLFITMQITLYTCSICHRLLDIPKSGKMAKG